MARNHTVTLRLNERYYRTLGLLAQEFDVAMSDVLKLALRELAERHPEALDPRRKSYLLRAPADPAKPPR